MPSNTQKSVIPSTKLNNFPHKLDTKNIDQIPEQYIASINFWGDVNEVYSKYELNIANKPDNHQNQKFIELMNDLYALASQEAPQLRKEIGANPIIALSFENQSSNVRRVNFINAKKQFAKIIKPRIINFIHARDKQQSHVELFENIIFAINEAAKQLVNVAEEPMKLPNQEFTAETKDKVNEVREQPVPGSSQFYNSKSTFSSSNSGQPSAAMPPHKSPVPNTDNNNSPNSPKPSSNKIPGVIAVAAAALTYYPAALAAKLIPTDYSKVIAGAAALVVGILAFYITKQILHPPSPKAKGCEVITVQPIEKNR